MKKSKSNSELLSRSKIVNNRRSTSHLDILPEITKNMYDNLPDFKSNSSGFINMSHIKKTVHF